MGYIGIKLHPVAGKCGVFAETDINGLQKQGVPPDELMASLFDAIILQNLTVLTRGHTLRPQVLLLGGPNTFIRGMREAGRHNIPRDLEGAQGRAARGRRPGRPDHGARERPVLRRLGAVEFGKDEDDGRRHLPGHRAPARSTSTSAACEEKAKRRRHGPQSTTRQELAAFKERYTIPKFVPARASRRARRCAAFIGLDGGSTSTKAVLLDEDRERPRPRPTSSRRATRSRTRSTCSRELAAAGRVAGRHARGAGRRHHRLRQGHPEGRAHRRRRAGRDRRAHRESALHFYHDADVIVRRRRPGHQAHRPEGRPRQGLQAQHAVLGRQRLLPAVAPPSGFGYKVERVRRHRLRRRDDADVRLRLRGVHAVRHRQLPAPGLDARGDHGRPGGRAAQEHLAVRRADSEPRQARARASCCRAARSTTWRRSSRRSISSSRASAATACSPEVIVHEHCGESGAIGAGARGRPPVRERPSRPRSSAWTRCRRSSRHRTATRRRAATSARTSACARSSTSRPGVIERDQ